MRQWAALVLLLSVSGPCLSLLALCTVEAIRSHSREASCKPTFIAFVNKSSPSVVLDHQPGCSRYAVHNGQRITGIEGSGLSLKACSATKGTVDATNTGSLSTGLLRISGGVFHHGANALSNHDAVNRQSPAKRSFWLYSFFGSISSVFTDAEYDHSLVVNKKYSTITDETDDSGLPLAPENEDYEMDDSIPECDKDLSRPPSSKEEWYLKRLARGRRFWHKYFADPSQQSLRFYRLVKMKHDMKFCNRVVHKKYKELRPEIKPEIVDGKEKPLTRRQRNQNRSRIQSIRTTIGYDNTSADSNILILLTLPQERLVKMVERIRLPHLLALRNFEMLRLLRHSMLFMSKPNIFESTVDFLLTFSRLNTEYSGDIPKFCDLPVKPVKRFRPMIYAVIGKLRNNPFPDHLLKVRSSTPPPIRDEFPRSVENENSVLSKFLDACQTLTIERLRNAVYDYDAILDRNFSDNFAEMMPSYCTKGSVNHIDYPVTISYSREMEAYLRESVGEPVSTNATDTDIKKGEETCDGDCIQDNSEHDQTDNVENGQGVIPRGSSKPWTADEVKLMLKRMYKLGLTKPSTLIERIRKLHCDIGFSFEDILWIGRTNPQVLRFGNYRQHCQQIYDCDEAFTFDDVLSMVREYPNLMGYNVMRCLKPKIYYLRRVMRRDISDLVSFPRALSYSLYERIIPRHLAIMNSVYKGEFLNVYRYLFESGFYKGYGQTITDQKVPDILPSDHGRYLEVYTSVNRPICLRQMLTLGDDEFIQHYGISYRELAQGKEDAIKIPLPTDLL
ncbi:hypothetical protein BgAZ_203560 [Babesia gibsoni]|uniref:Uncharacterized protein n=1 Tax=Babesia gibsoni TaxID=33632 RepID=A0AAD8LIQ6_BABGI|nr:hypothetical protein BgAZ_203560 [Babesia gibsoni]